MRRPSSSFWVAAALLAVTGPSRAWAADPEPKPALAEGTHAFQYLLRTHKFEVLKRFESLNAQSVLILLGDLNRLREVPRGVVSFVERGGAVLLASDRAV